ncbi:MAG: hypothetical protein HYX24_04740 [Candidatus Aenigmarchaeota archaeon]|nr:hypothetical protein [Candidatus Aenigmarchaeota archaeon]
MTSVKRPYSPETELLEQAEEVFKDDPQLLRALKGGEDPRVHLEKYQHKFDNIGPRKIKEFFENDQYREVYKIAVQADLAEKIDNSFVTYSRAIR